MGSLKDFFDFSSGQMRIISVLSAVALGLSGYLFIRSYTEDDRGKTDLKVYVSEISPEFTGVFIVDPNSSPADSLELLPGIGKVLAERIVEYRQHKKFVSESDITMVPGIGPKLYERLKPYLKVKQP